MHDAISSVADWASHRIHLIAAGVANTGAWAQAVNTGNYNVGLIVTFCTIALPSIVGGVGLSFKTLYPIWIQFRVDRANALSATNEGKMDHLIEMAERNSEKADRSDQAAEAARRLAATYAENLKLETESRKERDQRITELTQMVANGNQQNNDIQTQLQNLTQATQAAVLRADIAERNERTSLENQKRMQETIDQLKAQIQTTQIPIKETHEKVVEMTEIGNRIGDAVHEVHDILTNEAIRENPKIG